jgi:hypothetical protein
MRWAKWEEEYLECMIVDKRIKEIAIDLDRTVESIKSKVIAMGLQKNRAKTARVKERVEVLRSLNKRVSVTALSRELGYSRYLITKVIQDEQIRLY